MTILDPNIHSQIIKDIDKIAAAANINSDLVSKLSSVKFRLWWKKFVFSI